MGVEDRLLSLIRKLSALYRFRKGSRLKVRAQQLVEYTSTI